MSLLTADIGNSHTFVGLLDGDEVTAHWRVNTDERRTADEWGVLLRGLLAERVDDVDGIAVCATVSASAALTPSSGNIAACAALPV